MITIPRYFVYLSKNKIDMLHGQLLRKGFKFSDISPKLTVPGFEASINFHEKDEKEQSELYNKAQKVLSTMEKTGAIKPLLNQEPYIKFFNHDKSKWHCGILAEDFFAQQVERSESPSEHKKSIEGAYINFKIHRDSLILLIGSSNHLIGETDYHLDSSMPNRPLSTHRLLFNVPQFIQAYERYDNWWASRVAPIRYPSSAGYCLSLSEICLKKFVDYPESEIEIMFILYQKFDLRKTARELSQEISRDDYHVMESTRQWLESKVSKTNMLKFRYLYVGSPIFTAL
ncbi:MAG: hypothetical protein C4583_15110 [Anaerolineaceae bacterium]|nr:MAG: hypothetical protein C4583_15110 [Anaerolineaceae bacterium]